MFEWDHSILFLITIFGGYMYNILRGYYSKTAEDTPLNRWKFIFVQNIITLLSIILVNALSGTFDSFSYFSVGLGVLMGLLVIINADTNIRAFSCGPFSYTTVICSLGAIIPTLSGLFFGESITLIQYAGIALMAVCIILSPAEDDPNDKEAKKANFKWLVLTVIAAIASGFMGVIQKVHQSFESHRSEMAAMLISCFTVTVVFSAFKYFYERRKPSDPKHDKKFHKKELFLAAGAGFFITFPHTVNLFLAGRVPAIVFFPLVNLLPMILLMISAIFLFKERLSAKRWVGIAVGITSTVLVSGIIKI